MSCSADPVGMHMPYSSCVVCLQHPSVTLQGSTILVQDNKGCLLFKEGPSSVTDTEIARLQVTAKHCRLLQLPMYVCSRHCLGCASSGSGLQYTPVCGGPLCAGCALPVTHPMLGCAVAGAVWQQLESGHHAAVPMLASGFRQWQATRENGTGTQDTVELSPLCDALSCLHLDAVLSAVAVMQCQLYFPGVHFAMYSHAWAFCDSLLHST